jgi:hypothetical protein
VVTRYTYKSRRPPSPPFGSPALLPIPFCLCPHCQDSFYYCTSRQVRPTTHSFPSLSHLIRPIQSASLLDITPRQENNMKTLIVAAFVATLARYVQASTYVVCVAASSFMGYPQIPSTFTTNDACVVSQSNTSIPRPALATSWYCIGVTCSLCRNSRWVGRLHNLFMGRGVFVLPGQLVSLPHL